jgi:hypothetical protein
MFVVTLIYVPFWLFIWFIFYSCSMTWYLISWYLLFGYLFNLFFIHFKLFPWMAIDVKKTWRCCFERPYLYTEHKFPMLLYKYLNICSDLYIAIQICFYIMYVLMYMLTVHDMQGILQPNGVCLHFQIVHLLALFYWPGFTSWMSMVNIQMCVCGVCILTALLLWPKWFGEKK